MLDMVLHMPLVNHLRMEKMDHAWYSFGESYSMLDYIVWYSTILGTANSTLLKFTLFASATRDIKIPLCLSAPVRKSLIL